MPSNDVAEMSRNVFLLLGSSSVKLFREVQF